MNYINQDITTVTYGIIAHGVNCQGKMASGVAKFIRAKWPKAYESYISHVTDFGVGGHLLGDADIVPVGDELFVANCFTQEYYGYDNKKYADAQAIYKSLDRVLYYAYIHNLPVYLPKIGAKRGGLDWDNDVVPMIDAVMDMYPSVEVNICLWNEDEPIV